MMDSQDWKAKKTFKRGMEIFMILGIVVVWVTLIIQNS